MGLVQLYPLERPPLSLAGRLVVQTGVDAVLAAVDNIGLGKYDLWALLFLFRVFRGRAWVGACVQSKQQERIG